jgi:hypothetical protein
MFTANDKCNRNGGIIMKKFDKIIIALFIVVALVSAGAYTLTRSASYNNRKQVDIYLKGKLYKSLELTEKTNQKIVIDTLPGTNTLVIENGDVFMEDADCLDKICVKTGHIHNPGDTIVCLPHKLVVEIKGEGPVETDDVTY